MFDLLYDFFGCDVLLFIICAVVLAVTHDNY